MIAGNRVVLLLFTLMVLGACKKEAPYIDSLVGTYKVNGAMLYDTIPIRTVTDTLLTITKVDNWTLNFIRSSCDTTFRPVLLSYNWEDDSLISFNLTETGNSSNNAAIYFHRPLNASFTYNDGFWCGSAFVGVYLRGIKVQ
jgi:hypothetical protein